MKIRRPTTDDRPRATVQVTTNTLLLFSAVWLGILCSTVRCQTILVPSRLHVGETNTLLLISAASSEQPDNSSSATLRLFNKGFTHGRPLLSQEVHFKKGQQLTEVPLLLDSGQLTLPLKEQVTVEVIFPGSGAKASEDVEVSPGHGFVFLQTDKPIYRVSETVRFRVLRLDRRLSPLNESVVLKIANHQKIKVEEAVLVTAPPMHIAEHRFNFPLIAKPGTWMADLFYGPKHKLVASTSFDVTEYILPTFKIDFSLPPFILNTDETIEITMRVNYTFGKPVRGTVHYRYGLMDTVPTGAAADGHGHQQQSQPQRMSKLIGSSNPFCFDGGVMTHRASLGFLKGYTFPVRFVVEATVKECASNVLEKASDSSVLVVERPYTVALRKTIRRYKPNVSNFVTLEILDPHRTPVPGVPFTVEIKSTDKKNPVTLHPYIVSSTYEDTATGGPGRADPKTDAEGRVIFNFKTSDNTRSYDVRLATRDPRYSDLQQTLATFTIEPFNGTGEPASLWIENKRELTYRVGDRFQSHIATAGGPLAGDTVHLLVLSKGAVLLRETLQGPNNRSIDFEISNRMVPTVRLLVLATSAEDPKGILVADSLRLSVAPGARGCGVEVTMLGPQGSHTVLTQRRKKILPGGSVTFSVAGGRAGDVVGFHAIDEAIYVLRAGGRNASRNAYARALEQSDAGCGPGGGATSLEVIRTAGFKALSAGAPVHGRTDDSVCRRLVRRKRSAAPSSYTPVSAVATEAELEQCCRWAHLKSRLTLSCKTKTDIVREHTQSAACARRFNECCLQAGNRKFQAAASTTMNKNTNTKAAAAVETELIDSGGVDADLVRTDFRDTWLFDLKLLSGSGQQNFTFPTPHSITSWAVSTLSITERAGFCVNTGPHPHLVTTFKPFFIKVSFPPTIIEHEQTEVVVTVFNYHSGSRLSVRITFDKVDGICSDWLGAKRAVRNVQVNPSSSERTAFSIVPIYKGTHEIRIEAKSVDYTDTVVRRLTVLAPGIEREQQLTFDLDPLNRAKRETRVEGDFYTDVTTNSSQQTKVKLRPTNGGHGGGDWVTTQANVVPKTLHYVVTAVGERFTPQLGSIEELSALIRKPKGCGEQNMYYMAFNLYSLRYLEQIGRLTERTKRRGVAYLQRALQQQLDFRKADGSYAAFSKRASSVWLTGFVAKIVCQAEPYLESQLDERVVETALRWLADRQQANGAWKEEYPLLHEKALGGAEGAYGLTAYLMIVFHECRPYMSRFAEFASGGEQKTSSPSTTATLNLTRTIEMAERYLVARYTAKIDGKKSSSADSLRYRQALVAYALTFSASAKAATLRQSLTESLAAGSTIDWRRNQQWWADAQWPVETAAYALMAFIAPDLSDLQAPPVDILSYLSIVNWLNGQQKRGTFDNTQDTIVALDALAKYYVLYAKRYDADEVDRTGRGGGGGEGGDQQQQQRKRLHHELQTDVSFNHRLKRSLLFHNANADLLQTLQVDSDTREIDLKTTGTGLGKLNLLIIYNEYAPNGSCRFDLNVDVYEWRDEEGGGGSGDGAGSGGANSHVNQNEFDAESFFRDTPQKKAEMLYELGVADEVATGGGNKGRQLVDLPTTGGRGANISAVVNCCQDTRLVSKRSIFPTAYFTNLRRKPSSWKAVADRLRAEEERRQQGGQSAFSSVGTSKRSASERSKKKPARRQQPSSASASSKHVPGPVQRKSFAPLPQLSTELEHPIVLVLNICTRYYLASSSYSSDMAILEVSILSGFRPVQTDLEAIFSDSSAAFHGYIAHYDVSPSKVIFYFREVPSNFNQCVAFRVYQQHRVEKTQSALVRMYNYYEQEMVCSRLYTNVRQTDYIALKCDRNQNEAEKCRCVTNLRCPGSSVVDTILRSNRDYRDMEYLFCQHTHIIIGTIVSITSERTNVTGPSYEVPVMTVKVDEERGNITSGDIKPAEGGNNSTVVLYFNTECNLYVAPFKAKRSQRVIVMHNPGRDSRWLVDGNSVLKLLNDADYTEMTYFIDQAKRRGALTACSSSY